jgi:hypothetical protein
MTHHERAVNGLGAILASKCQPATAENPGVKIDPCVVSVPSVADGEVAWLVATSRSQLRADASIRRPDEWHHDLLVGAIPGVLGVWIYFRVPESVRWQAARRQRPAGTGAAPLLGDEPSTLAPHDVLAPGGVLEAMRRLRDEGMVQYLGLPGTGNPAALREVVRSGGFDTIQVPFNLLNPSAGEEMPASFEEANYGNIIAECAALGLGVFAIRVFAAGALLDQEPSAHTLKTPFFPLALYERDRQRAAELRERLGHGASLKAAALRFVLGHADVQSAIIGFGATEHVDEAAEIAEMRSEPV